MTPLESTKEELDEAGIAYEICTSRRHIQVRFKVSGVNCLVAVSRSSSDHRASLNARMIVRREIRKALERAKSK
ncbi:hypothetical protein CPT_Sonora_053 [Stenotrophomonas phage Sonora]|nr:hypothetical protein CPT_Sonora_053 [Stenotrophomonas phage Sonora]